MNGKLPFYMQSMTEQEMGIYPFVYGDDVNPRMLDEEMEYVNPSRKIQCRDRYTSIKDHEDVVNSALESCIRDGHNQMIIRHKMEKLVKSIQLKQVYDRLMSHKIFKMKNYDDFNLTLKSKLDDRLFRMQE